MDHSEAAAEAARAELAKSPQEREAAIREQVAAGKVKYQPAVGGPAQMNVPGTVLGRGGQAAPGPTSGGQFAGNFTPEQARAILAGSPEKRWEQVKRWAEAKAAPVAQSTRVNAEFEQRRDALAPLEAAKAQREREQGHALTANQIAAYDQQKQRILAGLDPLDYSAQQAADDDTEALASYGDYRAPAGYSLVAGFEPVYELARREGVTPEAMQALAKGWADNEHLGDHDFARKMCEISRKAGVPAVSFERLMSVVQEMLGGLQQDHRWGQR